MQKHEYNIFPEMQPDDYLRLKTDLLTNGYDTTLPIWLFEGKIIDGWNRQRACNEIGLQPVYAYFDGSKLDAIEFIMRTNKRRNLNSSQWATVAINADEIIQSIKDQVEQERRRKISERENVANQYTQKVEMGELIPPSANTKKEQNKTRTILAGMFNTNPRYIDQANRLKETDPETFELVSQGVKTLPEVEKEKKAQSIAAERKAKEEAGRLITNLDIDFRLGDFETVFSDIPDGSIDCIITDPPYPKEFLECWTKLARFAKRVLKPNGFCIAYSGQMYLPEVMSRMSEHLDYYWTFAVYHTGQTQIVNGVNLICRWKPVLIFQNGKQKISNTIQDYFISESREKTGHDWQQSLSGVRYLIEMFTNEGDLICEPFAGSGTTIVAAKQMNRKIVASEIDETAYNICKSNF